MKSAAFAIRYASGIALSAFLLFQVQPLIAAFILPWFGGSPAVWTTCLLFFQTALVGGYAYAHWISGMKPRIQGIVHIALLGLTLLVLPITPAETWKPLGTENPTLRILLLLSATVGAPYLLLSTTGPLLQRWFSLEAPATSPYRLYALSNAASLAGLLAFPFVVQPLWETHTQSALWSAAYAGFALVTGWSAFEMVRQAPHIEEQQRATHVELGLGSAPWTQQIRWLLLAGTGTALLLSTTNTLTQDVAAVPFLWVVPLALYLLSFIIAFERPQWYRRAIFIPAVFVLALPSTLPFSWPFEGNTPFLVEGTSLIALTFAGCMVCHGELVRLTPPARHLTLFYLVISVGGALGGLGVAVVAPLIFPHFFELTIAVAVVIALPLFLIYQESSHPLGKGKKIWAWCAITVAYWVVVLGLLGGPIVGVLHAREIERNFFGVLRVEDQVSEEGDEYRTMHHGYVLHGLQFQADEWRREPTTYYYREAGVGLGVRVLSDLHPEGMRVGLIGLGAGTLAAYGRDGDTYRFYEINPSVIRLAQSEFTFLADSAADVEIVVGDARLSLERELAGGEHEPFDLLVVDAFSGDSIPVHLITQEAFELYDRALAEGGALAIHLSNQHLQLEPVAFAALEASGYQAALIEYNERGGLAEASTWVLASRNEAFISDERIIERSSAPPVRRILWTDNYSSLFRILE